MYVHKSALAVHHMHHAQGLVQEKHDAHQHLLLGVGLLQFVSHIA